MDVQDYNTYYNVQYHNNNILNPLTMCAEGESMISMSYIMEFNEYSNIVKIELTEFCMFFLTRSLRYNDHS